MRAGLINAQTLPNILTSLILQNGGNKLGHGFAANLGARPLWVVS